MRSSLSVLVIGPTTELGPALEKIKLALPAEISSAVSPADAVTALLRQSWQLIVFALVPDFATGCDWVHSLSGILAAKHSGPVWGIVDSLSDSSGEGRVAMWNGLNRILPVCVAGQEWQSAIESLAPPVATGFDAEGLIDRMMGNETLARHVVHTFLVDMPRQLLALENAILAEDAVRSARSAHSIKGASANSGLDRIVAVARRMETAFDAGDISSGSTLLPVLVESYEAVEPELKEFCG